METAPVGPAWGRDPRKAAFMPHSVGGTPSGPFEIGCNDLHPVGCAETLCGNSVSDLVVTAMEHGAAVHGFTAVWYSRERRDSMAAAITRGMG